jgi:hypothetical protein
MFTLKLEVYNDTLVCMFGDGNIPAYFGFNFIVDELNTMATSLDELI